MENNSNLKQNNSNNSNNFELDYEAILLILKDLRSGKTVEGKKENIVDILENLDQFYKKFKKDQKELEVIKELIQKLNQSLEVNAVMKYVAEAIYKLFPEVTSAYIMAPQNFLDFYNNVYVYAPQNVGEKHLKEIKNYIQVGLKEMPAVVTEQNKLKEWLEKGFNFKLIRGKRDKNFKKKPQSNINVPILVPKVISGLVSISALDKEYFSRDKLNIIYTIVGSATQTIERLKTLIDSEHSRLEDLVQSMSNGVLMFDNNKDVIVANPSIKNVIGIFSEEDISLKDFLELFKEKEKGMDEEVELIINEVMKSSKTVHFEGVKLKDRIFEIFINPVHDHRKRVSGGAVIIHDITHQKEVERMKTEFVSMASHQLRTPLTAIRLFLDMLIKEGIENFSGKQQEYVHTIKKSSQRMINLVNDLLNVSRLETGRLKVNPIVTQLEDLIQSVIEEVVPLGKEQKCAIMFKKPDSPLPEMSIDPILFRQVVHNLIVNSIRYSIGKKCKIEIQLKKVSWNQVLKLMKKSKIRYVPNNKEVAEKKANLKGEHMLLAVRDQGIGIPVLVQSQIFEKFYRADNAKKLITEGSGLGLYINKVILNTAGGKIWFESKEGEGSIFYITLPLAGMKKKEAGNEGMVG